MAGPIRISILADDRASRVFASVGTNVGGVSTRIGKATKAMSAAVALGTVTAGAAVAKLGVDAVKSASDAQQSLGATETVFGKYADTVIKRSNQAANAIGVSANEYRELSNVVGASLRGVGFPLEQTANLTDNLNRRAADMAATFGGTTKDAVEAISSLMRGEADPIERYGVSIKATDVAARLAANGQDELTGAALKQAEMQARLDILFQKTAVTQGAFAKESDTLAHQQQVLAAKFENIKAKVGTALLPVLTSLLTYLNDHIGPAFRSVKDSVGVFVEAIAPAVTFVRGLFDSFNGSDQAASKMAELRTTVQQVWESISSIFRSAVDVVRALWQAFGKTIVKYARSTFSNVVQIVRGGFKVVQGIFDVVAGLLKGDWSRVWKGIQAILSGAWTVIKALVKQGWNIIRTAFSVGATVLKGLWSRLWDGVKSLLSAAWGQIKAGTSRGIAALIDLVKSLPSRITGALGDLGGLLLGAGRAVIQGLLDGIGSMVGQVKDKLGELTDLIPDWKGPRERDKTLLRPAGQIIIGGLIKGFDDGRAGVKATLGDLTDFIEKTFKRRGRTSKQVAALTRRATKSLRDETSALLRNARKREQVYRRLDRAEKALAEARKKRAEYAANVKRAALSFASITGLDAAFNSDAMLARLRDRLAKISQFNTVIRDLIAKGLNQTAIDQLAQAGVEGGLASAVAIQQGGTAAIAEFNDLQAQIDKAAGRLGKASGGAMHDAGVDAAKGLVKGLDSQVKRLERYAKKLGRRLVKALARELDLTKAATATTRAATRRDTAAHDRTRGPVDDARRDRATREYTINVTAPLGSNPAEIGRQIVRYVDAYEKAGGRRAS